MVVPSAIGPAGAKADLMGVKRQRHRPESSAFLDLWLQQNNNNLYPSKDEKERLVKETQLNYNQVSRWFANRRRKLKLRNCVSPSSSTAGLGRNSSSPSDSTGEVPGNLCPQAPNCPGNATVWNDGSITTGGISASGASLFPSEERKALDSVSSRDAEILHNYGLVTSLLQDSVEVRPAVETLNAGQQLPPSFFQPQEHLPTPPALAAGIYPPNLPGKNPLFGLSTGLDLNTGMLNPYFLSALASGVIYPPVSNPWMTSGFLPSFCTSPSLSPPEEKQKVIEEEERERVAEAETEDAHTQKLLMELTEKESIAVSVLAEFASQRKHRGEISVLV